MSTAEGEAVMEGVALHEELEGVVDDRTLEILERRRRTAVVRRRGWLVRRMLLLADLCGLTIAFLLAQYLVGPVQDDVGHVAVQVEFLVFLATLPIWIVVAKLYGLYDRDEERADHSTTDELIAVFHLVTVGAWMLFAGSWLTGFASPQFVKVSVFWALAIGTIGLGRALARAVCRRRMTYLQNTVILGAGEVGQLIARKVLQHPEYGINLVGFIDSAPKERRPDLEHLTLLGAPERLTSIVKLFDIERVVIAFSNESHEETLDHIRSLKDLDVQVDIVPRLFEIVGPSVGIHTVEGLPLVGLPPLKLARSSRLLKRAMDFILAGAGLLLLAPLFALIVLAIRLESSGPIFFRQVRMGAGDRTFRIYKFRTMAIDADARKKEFAHLNQHARPGGDARMFKIPDDPRVTRVGRLLRRYSLDELPQLVNVVKGEMSLVGPRPLILDEDQRVESWGRQRLTLKPGVTGPWQVLGRSDIPFEEMVKLDYLYVTGWSAFTDLKLILRTIPALFRVRGAY
jgi:exopolysaccharide biosynthesis polyprenyl glycosylphosphotransferase